MSKTKKKKIEKEKRRRKQREQPKRTERKIERELETKTKPKKGERTFRDYVKKFYSIMRNNDGRMSGLDIEAVFEKNGWGSLGPAFLWKIWRSVEEHYPFSIEFKPYHGWIYKGPPEEMVTKKKRKLK